MLIKEIILNLNYNANSSFIEFIIEHSHMYHHDLQHNTIKTLK